MAGYLQRLALRAVGQSPGTGPVTRQPRPVVAGPVGLEDTTVSSAVAQAPHAPARAGPAPRPARAVQPPDPATPAPMPTARPLAPPRIAPAAPGPEPTAGQSVPGSAQPVVPPAIRAPMPSIGRPEAAFQSPARSAVPPRPAISGPRVLRQGDQPEAGASRSVAPEAQVAPISAAARLQPSATPQSPTPLITPRPPLPTRTSAERRPEPIARPRDDPGTAAVQSPSSASPARSAAVPLVTPPLRQPPVPPPQTPAPLLQIGRISVEVMPESRAQTAVQPRRPAPSAPSGVLSGSSMLGQRFGLGQV